MSNADRRDQLRVRSQLDFLKVLAVLVRKYGNDGVVEITHEDLRAGPRGGLEREIDEETGTLRYVWKESETQGGGSGCGSCALTEGHQPNSG